MQIRISSTFCVTTVELTQSVGWVTLARCLSSSFSFNLLVILGSSAAGCLFGLWTTGVTVGSILIECVLGIDPVAFTKSGYSSRRSLRLWSITCIRLTRFRDLNALADRIGF